MARRKKKLSPIYVASIGAHVAIGAVLALIPQERLREVVAIAMNEAPKQEKKPEPPKPPPRAEPASATHRPARAPRTAAAPQLLAAAANAAPAFTDLGLTLDSSSSDGLAVNIAPPAPRERAPQPMAASIAKPKVLITRKTAPECGDPLIKPQPLGIVRPAYTEDARRARIEGRLRVEVLVDERGAVTGARVLDGLGHGLDEAALTSAKNLRFAAATQCGRPVAATFVIAMRFLLGT